MTIKGKDDHIITQVEIFATRVCVCVFNRKLAFLLNLPRFLRKKDGEESNIREKDFMIYSVLLSFPSVPHIIF